MDCACGTPEVSSINSIRSFAWRSCTELGHYMFYFSNPTTSIWYFVFCFGLKRLPNQGDVGVISRGNMSSPLWGTTNEVRTGRMCWKSSGVCSLKNWKTIPSQLFLPSHLESEAGPGVSTPPHFPTWAWRSILRPQQAFVHGGQSLKKNKT